jgi:hypothetical protein
MSYYEDELSKWYISANNKHSTFINQLKDETLTAQTEMVIDSKKFDSTFDTRFNFDVNGKSEQFSVWVDEDPTRNKLYRLTPGENSSKPLTSNTGGGSGSGSGFKPNTGERGWFDSKSHDLVTLEQYKEKSASDFSIRPLTTKEKSPNNYMISENGKKQVYLWIGKWMKPNT